MNHLLYDREDATRLLPLLNSITREITERQELLEKIEAGMKALDGKPQRTGLGIHDLVAEAAMNRRELRHAREELFRLGCSIVGTAPMTIRIPGCKGDSKRSFVYRSGETVLR